VVAESLKDQMKNGLKAQLQEFPISVLHTDTKYLNKAHRIPPTPTNLRRKITPAPTPIVGSHRINSL